MPTLEQMQNAQKILKALGYNTYTPDTQQVTQPQAVNNVGNLGNPQVAQQTQQPQATNQNLTGLGAQTSYQQTYQQPQQTQHVKLMDVPALVQQLVEAQKNIPMPQVKLSNKPTLEREQLEEQKAQNQRELNLSWFKTNNPTVSDSDVIRDNKMYLFNDLAKTPLDKLWADASKQGRSPSADELNKALGSIKSQVYAKAPEMMGQGLTKNDIEAIIDYAYNLAGIPRPKEEGSADEYSQILSGLGGGGISYSNGTSGNPYMLG